MEIALRTTQSVCIIIDGRISGVSIRKVSPVLYSTNTLTMQWHILGEEDRGAQEGISLSQYL